MYLEEGAGEHRCAVHVNEWCGVRSVKRVVRSAWCEGSDWRKEWLLPRIPGVGSLRISLKGLGKLWMEIGICGAGVAGSTNGCASRVDWLGV